MARRSGESEKSRDRWLVSYSDFSMLLFAFFAVLFASSYRNNSSIPVVSRAIHSGFQEMGTFSPAESKNGIVQSPGDSSSGPVGSPEVSKMQPASAASLAELRLLQRQLEAAMGQELRKHEVIMRPMPDGFIISLNEIGFFGTGSATLLPGAAEKIKRIAEVLSRYGFNIRIEGNSDNRPIHNGQYRSNWELSTSRAMTVLPLIVNESSFDPAKLSVAGYGEYRPVASNDTPEGRKLNRRVDLVVVAAAR